MDTTWYRFRDYPEQEGFYLVACRIDKDIDLTFNLIFAFKHDDGWKYLPSKGLLPVDINDLNKDFTGHELQCLAWTELPNYNETENSVAVNKEEVIS